MANELPVALFIVLICIWLLACLLQIVDVGTGHFVRRAGRTAGSRDRDRILTWMIAIGSLVLIAVGVGVDFSLRLILSELPPLPAEIALLLGLMGLVLTFAVAVVTGLLTSRALRKPQIGYQVIRDELRTLSGSRLSKGRIADYRAWLSAIDERKRDLKSKIIVGRIVRALPVVIALATIAISIWAVVSGVLPVWILAVAILALVISLWLAIWGGQISLARNLAIYAVHQKQRLEALELLTELERKTPRKVAGLSERVSRALAILREQQTQPTQENRSR